MRIRRCWYLLLALLCTSFAAAQTADELVAKNIEAKGGRDKIKALNTVRMSGKFEEAGFTALVGEDLKRPNMVRQTFTIQGMTQIQSFDGSSGWQIQPFGGRKDPEMLGEDDLRDLEDVSDIEGPLLDYKAKGNNVEYLGHDTVDGDDAYKLKVTLKNGDILYYYLDPDTYVEIRILRQQFIRGNVKELTTDLGSFKPVAGVMFPFSLEVKAKDDPDLQKITFQKIEANVPIDDAEFKMPVKK
jgi:outer membrane lipoprotein-sorting protein